MVWAKDVDNGRLIVHPAKKKKSLVKLVFHDQHVMGTVIRHRMLTVMGLNGVNEHSNHITSSLPGAICRGKVQMSITLHEYYIKTRNS